MGKKDRKKGQGAEKTALKTEKKALNRIKKNLAAKGEDDIEKLIAEYQAQGKKTNVVGEELCPQPSPRSGFSLISHPDKEELVLFGGEYYNGNETTMYNDIYFYNIKKQQWSLLMCSAKPPPRCSHQAVAVSQQGGQMWVFGGEFASPTRSNFYHYKDLWVFHFAEKRWEQVKASGCPSARSGHRMIVHRKQIILFGGFHEIVGDYLYFNDTYIFNLESLSWNKIEPVGKVPTPRSGCLMAPVMDGRVFLYGGYSKEKVKKDVDKGVAHTDMYFLHLDERITPPKWKWVQVKPSGIAPSSRSGFSIAVAANNHAFAFGGVRDEDRDEENLMGIFHNDLFLLELENGRWMPVTLHGNSSKVVRKRRRREKDSGEMIEEECDESEEVAESMEKATLSDKDIHKNVTTFDDSIFTVKIGPSCSSSSSVPSAASSSAGSVTNQTFIPPARMNASMAVKNGILYLYGGIYEDGDRQFTLSDFYSLDIHKLDEWRTIVPFSTTNLEWMESEESESESDESREDMGAEASSSADEEMDTQ